MPYFLSVKRHVASLREAGVFQKSWMEKLVHKCLHLICRMSVVSTVSKIFCSLSVSVSLSLFFFSSSSSPSWPRFNNEMLRLCGSQTQVLFIVRFFFSFLACEPDVFLSFFFFFFCHVKKCSNFVFVKMLFSVMVFFFFLTVSCLLILLNEKVYLNWRFYIF